MRWILSILVALSTFSTYLPLKIPGEGPPLSFIGLKSGTVESDSLSHETGSEESVIYQSPVHVSEIESKKRNSYQLLQLKNKVTVILTSVPGLEKCEVSLLNQVGYAQDPTDIQGLGNLLLNVLVSSSSMKRNYGLKDFTIDNSADMKVSLYSTYAIIEILASSRLFEGLMRYLADAFKFPEEINDEVLEKALNLIESEYLKPNSSLESLAVTRILSHSLSPAHRDKFCSRQTLKKALKENNVDVRKRMKEFFSKEYSSNRLILSLKSNLSLVEMKNLTEKLFSQIENKDLTVQNPMEPSTLGLQNPLLQSTGKVLYSLDNIGGFLKLFFPLKNYLFPYSKSDPTFFIWNDVCGNANSSLKKFLVLKGLASRVSCMVVNNFLGYSTLNFTFQLLEGSWSKIPVFLAAFFAVISRLKRTKPDLNLFRKSKEELLKNATYSKVNDEMESKFLLLNYFAHKSTAFNSLLLGNFEFEPFDIRLHDQILLEITPENMIIVLDCSDIPVETGTPEQNKLFEQSLAERDCSKFAKYLSELSEFRHFSIMNVSPDNIKSSIKNSFGLKYILESQHPCLSKILTENPESLSNDLKMEFQEADKLDVQAPIDSNRGVRSTSFPLKLWEILKENSDRVSNFEVIKDFFYFVPQEPQEKVFLGLNAFFPFEDRIVASIPSAKALAALLIIRELFMSFSTQISGDFGNQVPEVVPKVYLPSDSVINSFGFSFVISAAPHILPKVLERFGVFMKNTYELDANVFQDFVIYLKSYYTEVIEARNPKEILMDFLSKMNSNQDLSEEAIIKELDRIRVEEVRRMVTTIFIDSKLTGIAYGNLYPKEAEKYLGLLAEKLFNGLNRKRQTQKHKTISRLFIGTKRRATRLISGVSRQRRRTKSKITIIGKKGRSLKLNLKNLSKKRDPKRNISFRNPLYKSYSKSFKPKSTTCGNLRIFDYSSLKPQSRLFFNKTSKKVIKSNISILWVYVDSESPESFVFAEFLKYVCNNRLTANQKNLSDMTISVKEQKFATNALFITFEAVSFNLSASVMNKVLIETVEKLYLSSQILNEDLFSGVKEVLLRKYRMEGFKRDTVFGSIFNEIVNMRNDFFKFRSVNTLLKELTFSQFTSNVKKVVDSHFMILLSISKLQEADVSAPGSFTKIYSEGEISDRLKIRSFNPSSSRIDKNLSGDEKVTA
ncbi:secreted insulinase-like peptidase [Cryptosporidium felis]|nr:secreted insulinase-like peptidase [Cryptosporidium felis]